MVCPCLIAPIAAATSAGVGTAGGFSFDKRYLLWISIIVCVLTIVYCGYQLYKE